MWCPGVDGAFEDFAVVDHDGDVLVLGRLDGANDLPPLKERVQVRAFVRAPPSVVRCLAE